MKQRGFTLIELMTVIVIGLIALTVIVNAVGFVSSNGSISFGVNGMTESRCIEGYKFIIGEHGQPRQILDELGKGVRCELIEPGKPGSFGRM